MGSLAITYTAQTPILAWNAYVAAHPLGYNVYRSPSPGGPWTKLNDTQLAVLMYQDTDFKLTSERRAYWKVVAVTSEGEQAHAGSAPYLATLFGPTKWAALEIVRRHNLMFDKFSGESCDLYLMRQAGEPCSECGRISGDGYRNEHENRICLTCYNTGITGGFVKLSDEVIRIRNAQEVIEMLPEGYRLGESRIAFVPPYPIMEIGDFIVRPNGERFSIKNVRRREIQGYITLQVCTIDQLEPGHYLQEVNL